MCRTRTKFGDLRGSSVENRCPEQIDAAYGTELVSLTWFWLRFQPGSHGAFRVSCLHLRFGVGTVWRGIRASGGWRCLPSLGETQCRQQAWPYGGDRQLGRVRGQARGRHPGRSGGTGGTWSGWTPSIRHPSPISTPGRVGIRGGVAGAPPPHKGGPNRPDRPELQ